LNSAAACRIGSKSRRQIEDILNFIFRKAHCLDCKDRKSGLWYWGGEDGKRLVITSLTPFDSTLENGVSKEIYEHYQGEELEKAVLEELGKVLAALRNQTPGKLTRSGRVLVVQPRMKGAWVEEMSYSMTSEEVANQLERWQAGVYNGLFGNCFRYPGIRDIMRVLNLRCKRSGDVLTPVESKSRHAPFVIEDMYQLFLDDMGVVHRMVEYLGTITSRYMIQMPICSIGKGAFSLLFAHPACNIVLHKLGFTKESYMKTWAYQCGRLMQLANGIHRWYFTSRGMQPPKVLVGHQYITSLYDNPQVGLALFFRRFQLYLTWAEDPTNRCGWGVKAHREIVTIIQEAIGENELPLLCSNMDKIQMALGYTNRDPKVVTDEPPETELETEAESET
jgi:hypothetical protein